MSSTMSSTIIESSAMKQHHPQLPPYLRPPPPSTPSASATAPSSPAPAPPASSGQRHGSTQHSHDHHHHHHHSLPPPGPPPSRVHTLDLKGKLAAALGNHGKQYWNGLLHFCSAKISRDEFEQQARSCLRSEDVHLHNSLVLGILYNASSAVPGPSSIRGVATSTSLGDGAAADGGDHAPSASSKSLLTDTMEPRKRLRLLVASLTAKERQRIKSAGKPPARSFASGASASSWAGAGADLLEKRRKEEDKRQREADRRRLCELYTEIGANDWMQEAHQAEGARRDHQPKLTNSTLQSLLRSEQVPLCSQSRQLPDADSLGDVMTPHAVESGLSAGVTGDAAALMLAGVQAHVQNLVSNLILAIRTNRPAGGVRIEERGTDSMSGDVSIDSASGDADSSAASSMSFDTTSPTHGAMLQLPDGGTAYLPSLRIHRDDDSRRGTSTGSHSVASTAPSSIFDTSASSNRRHLYASTADSSMASLASTAPTSVGHHSDDDGSSNGAKRRRDASDDDEGGDSGDMDVDAQPQSKMRFDAGDIDGQATSLPHRRLFGSSGDRPTQSSLRPKLGLRDAAFLFELTPHVAVEPLGVSSLERLIGADAEDVTDVDLEAEEGADENKPASTVGLDAEQRLALAARRCAFSKASTEGVAAPAHLAIRHGYLVNQQGPLSLILDQTTERRKAGTDEREGGKEDGSTTAPSAPKRTRVKEPDPAVDVIDPVKLLAGLCD